MFYLLKHDIKWYLNLLIQGRKRKFTQLKVNLSKKKRYTIWNVLKKNFWSKLINIVQKNIATIVIEHRLSTINNPDIIYVINKGNIIERGKYNEWLGLNGKRCNENNSQKNLVSFTNILNNF